MKKRTIFPKVMISLDIPMGHKQSMSFMLTHRVVLSLYFYKFIVSLCNRNFNF